MPRKAAELYMRSTNDPGCRPPFGPGGPGTEGRFARGRSESRVVAPLRNPASSFRGRRSGQDVPGGGELGAQSVHNSCKLCTYRAVQSPGLVE